LPTRPVLVRHRSSVAVVGTDDQFIGAVLIVPAAVRLDTLLAFQQLAGSGCRDGTVAWGR
jgi:hypothetical protein